MVEPAATDGGAGDPLLVSRLRQALETLTPVRRTVLELHVVEGRTPKDISAMLAIPLHTVNSRLWRARKQLRTALNPPARHRRDVFEQAAA